MSSQSFGPAAKKLKVEHDSNSPSSTTSSTATTTAATQQAPSTPAYSTTPQWNAQIPIDPALQQQPPPSQHPIIPYAHYQYAAPSQHYTQQPYPTHFAYQTQPIPQTQTQTQTTATVSRQPTQTNGVDTTDITTLNDALGSAGVDLRAEEETLQRSQDRHTTYRQYEDRTRKQPSSIQFDTRLLGTTIREISTRHKVTRVPEDSINYVALALRFRLQSLIKSMIAAANHRADAQFDHPPAVYDEDGTPMWGVVVRKDLRKQLEVLERIEREEEMKIRRERKERADALAAQAAAAGSANLSTDSAGVGGGDDSSLEGGPPVKKPKKKKDGPGVTAKNLSEDIQKRLSNAVATQAAGIGRGKYAWMNAGTVVTPAQKAKVSTSGSNIATPGTGANPSSGTANSTTGTANTQTGNGAASASNSSSTSWAKPYVSPALKGAGSPQVEDEGRRTVTMRDAMFVIERERGHGAGRGAARGWV